MVYVCELGSGHSIYLEGRGAQTIITTVSSSPGQQQQANHSISTGVWTAPPEIYRTPNGSVIKVFTAQGEVAISVQGNTANVTSATSFSGGGQQMQMQQVASTPSFSMPTMEPMQPMQPMQPLKMGNMEISMNPMEMRMGNMEMRMGNATAASTSTSTPSSSTRRFCSQCGTAVEPSDRFCSNCGYKLA
jgi:NADH pyrophosphatase NudC (nudix superfamily)